VTEEKAMKRRGDCCVNIDYAWSKGVIFPYLHEKRERKGESYKGKSAKTNYVCQLLDMFSGVLPGEGSQRNFFFFGGGGGGKKKPMLEGKKRQCG